METLAALSWKVYPAVTLMAIGFAIFWIGWRRASRGLSLFKGVSPDIIMFVTGFRIAVIGVTIAGLGASWNWNLTWLFVLSLVFGGEELLESTVHLSILRWNPGYGCEVKAEASF